jgi:hypothetical protein
VHSSLRAQELQTWAVPTFTSKQLNSCAIVQTWLPSRTRFPTTSSS